jgi:hypothetical protein
MHHLRRTDIRKQFWLGKASSTRLLKNQLFSSTSQIKYSERTETLKEKRSLRDSHMRLSETSDLFRNTIPVGEIEWEMTNVQQSLFELKCQRNFTLLRTPETPYEITKTQTIILNFKLESVLGWVAGASVHRDRGFQTHLRESLRQRPK